MPTMFHEVAAHKKIRSTCRYCGKRHKSSRHRFHGRGSYARTHRGRRRKHKRRR